MYLGFYLFPYGQFVPRWTRWIMFMGIGVSIFLIIFPRYSSALLNANPGSKISRLLFGRNQALLADRPNRSARISLLPASHDARKKDPAR